MKYVTLAIIAVLIFGVAASPVFSGTAFAQTEEQEQKQQISDEKKAQHAENSEIKDKKQQVSDEKKAQRSVDQKDISYSDLKHKLDNYCDMTPQQKRQFHNDYPQLKMSDPNCGPSDHTKGHDKPHRDIKEQRSQLIEKFSNFSEDRKQKMQDRLDAMKEKRGVQNQNTIKERFSGLTADERQAEIDKIREERKLEREAQQNMTMEEKLESLSKLKEKMQERRESHVSPLEQMSLGFTPNDVMCAEDKELVIRASSGMPTCVSSDTAVLLINRGLVTFTE